MVTPLTQGCTSYFKILSASVESVAAPNMILVVEVDLDLQTGAPKDYTTRFAYVVLDEVRLRRLRALRRDLPPTVDEAGPVLISDYHDHFVVFRWSESGEIRSRELIAENGGLEPGLKVAEGRWRHRIAIPLRMSSHDYPANPGQASFTRPGAYELLPGSRYRLWGQIWSVTKAPGGYISSVCEVDICVPER